MNNRMKSKSFGIFGIAMLSFMMVAGFAAAARTLDLTAAKPHPQADGRLSLTDSRIELTAENLKPDSVYTVWFVNTRPSKQEAGAGTPPYSFKTDADGKGTYTAPLDEPPFGKWQMIMVVLHPDGDAKNMKNMVGALSAEVPAHG